MNSADINSMSNNELDRIAMEYNKLQYNASLITDIQAIKDLHPVSINKVMMWAFDFYFISVNS